MDAITAVRRENSESTAVHVQLGLVPYRNAIRKHLALDNQAICLVCYPSHSNVAGVCRRKERADSEVEVVAEAIKLGIRAN